MTEEERAVFQKALDTWGGDAQILCLLEEMAELQDALCKHKRGRRTTDDIAEEIADVEIMLNQMKLYFRVEEEVKAQRARKVGRVEERLRSRTNRPQHKSFRQILQVSVLEILDMRQHVLRFPP